MEKPNLLYKHQERTCKALFQVEAHTQTKVEIERAMLINGGNATAVREVIPYPWFGIEAETVGQLIVDTGGCVQGKLPRTGIEHFLNCSACRKRHAKATTYP